MGLKKVKTIVKAFKELLPVEEDWYKTRLEICKSCDKNTDNIADEDLSFLDKLKNTNLCTEGRSCTACGCCIDQKCSVKTEVCGMIKLGKSPKWTALAIDSVEAVMEVISENYKLTKPNNEFLLDVGRVSDKVVEMQFRLFPGKGLEYKTSVASCGCTVPQISKNLDGSLDYVVKISTIGFKPGLAEKTMKVVLVNRVQKESEVYIRFRLIKE
jgi:hypothetical protein